MPQHISLRVPWHDHGWDGTVCADPQNNNACLRLRNISESRDDKDWRRRMLYVFPGSDSYYGTPI